MDKERTGRGGAGTGIRCGVHAVGVAVLILFFASGVSAAFSYTFPERFEVVFKGGSNFGALSDFRDLGQTGFMFVDYSVPAARVDQAFNYTSQLATPFLSLFGIVAMTVQKLPDREYLVYSNDSGTHCSMVSGVGLIPRFIFADTSAFVGNITYHGQPARLYNCTGDPFCKFVPLQLVQSAATLLPLAWIAPSTQVGVEGEAMDLVEFIDSSSRSYDPRMFQLPPSCQATLAVPVKATDTA